MKTRIIMFAFFAGLLGLHKAQAQTPAKATSNADKVVKTAQEWRAVLTANQYYILREKGTERAYTGENWNNHDKGIYVCAACGQALFSSDTKFESGTGWPSFYQALNKNAVKEVVDRSYGMSRTEVMCNRCEGHLGHVFDDGPKPTGLRYCMNGGAMKFKKQ